MRIGEILYFSPKYRFDQVNWDNKEELIEAFQDRVEGFYLNPVRILNRGKHAFAAGVLCVTVIDFLARITINSERVGQRIKKWLTEDIREFDETLAQRFYEEFRNGLVHEGRIKNAGQFSYEFDKLVNVKDSVMIVNPKKLLEAIEKSFNGYMKIVKKNEFEFQAFKCALIRDFQRDVKYASR